MLCIYKITNKLNGKVYIGKTKNLVKRLYDHRNTKKTYIGRAIRKYGSANFTIEVIYETLCEIDLAEKELHFIQQHNSKTPYGYNCTFRTDGKVTFVEKTKRAISKKGQQVFRAKGKNSLSIYIGVRKPTVGANFVTIIQFKNKTMRKCMLTEIGAAELYDKMALFFYGKNARINFPENIDRYLSEDLQSVYDFFISKRTKTSKYCGVYLKRKNKWVAFHKSKGKTKYIGTFETEEKARIARENYESSCAII